MSEINETSGQKKSNGVFLLIIIALLLGMGYMAYLISNKKGELEICRNEVDTLNKDITGMNEMMEGYLGNMSHDLKSDLRNMLDTYQALKEKDASQADKISEQEAQIQELLNKVESGKYTAHQLFLMKKENETLRNIMKGYVKQIDSLNTLNLKLTSDLDETTTKLSTTTQERDAYKEDAAQKAEIVKKGSRLSAYGFSSGGLREKLNNTTTATSKANNCVQIKSSFTIGENSIADQGRKTVYMQIITPEGKTLQSRSSNIVETDQGPVPYSDKKDIDYNNQSVDVAIYYNLGSEEASKGNYKIKIYCQGQLIGSDSFTLK